MAWFHPHEAKIISRTRGDLPLDVHLLAEPDITGDIALSISHAGGSLEQFALFAEKVESMVLGIVED
jgi:hypothetical protein